LLDPLIHHREPLTLYAQNTAGARGLQEKRAVSLLDKLAAPGKYPFIASDDGAGDGIRTRDLLITNQLLYH
jgi:hypothetical protein